MGILDRLLGGLLVGNYANSILFTLEIVAFFRYQKYNKESSLFRAVVYFTVIADTLSTVVDYAGVYLYAVSRWGDAIYLRRQHWPSVVSLITSTITAAIVQCFLISRFWRMSKNIYVAFVLGLLMFTAFGGGVASVVSLLMYAPFAEQSKMALSMTIRLSTSAATDVAIASALLWQLGRIKSPLRTTQSRIYRLMRSAMRTGTVTSVFAVITLILYVIDNESSVSTAFAFCLARLYSLTMLYVLNSGTAYQRRRALSNADYGNNATNVMSGFQMQRTTTVHYESSADPVPRGLSDSLKDKEDSGSFVAEGKAPRLT